VTRRSSHLFQRVASFLRSGKQITISDVVDIVLISFREWLHSYDSMDSRFDIIKVVRSHLFQRVASFLHIKEYFSNNTSIWQFSSLSESGFIPTDITE